MLNKVPQVVVVVVVVVVIISTLSFIDSAVCLWTQYLCYDLTSAAACECSDRPNKALKQTLMAAASLKLCSVTWSCCMSA